MKPLGRFRLVFILATVLLPLASKAVVYAEETEMEPLPPEEAEKALRATVNRHRPTTMKGANPQVIISGPSREVGSLLREMGKVDLYDAHEKKGDEYMGRSEYQLAISEYEAALQVAKEYDFPGIAHGSSHRNLARANEALGNYPEAIHHVQILLDHWPSDLTRPKGELWKKALESAALGHFDESVQTYQQLLEKAEDWERPEIQRRLDAMKARAEDAFRPRKIP